MNYLTNKNYFLSASYHISNYTATYTKLKKCKDAIRSQTISNAGGSSKISETFAILYFFTRCGPSVKFALEMEVKYDYENVSICDFIMTFQKQNFGVSVTRAISLNRRTLINEFSYDNALTLLKKKLQGLTTARNSISSPHNFTKSILLVWCPSLQSLQYVISAYSYIISNSDFDDDNTQIFVLPIICDDKRIYSNKN